MNVRLPAVSLFSNCGAGDVGFRKAGFRFQVLAELHERRLDVAKLNHPGAEAIPGDLRETWSEVVSRYRARMGSTPPALLAACPPCQGMSSAQSKRGHSSDADAGSRDERNLLIETVASVAAELRPRAIVIENVVAFLTRQVRHPDTNDPISAARLFIDRLAGDYESFAIRTDLADFGVPQSRKRAFLVLVRRDEQGLNRLAQTAKAPFPKASHGPGTNASHVSLRTALDALGAPPLDSRTEVVAGEGLHRVPVWDERRYRMVSSIPKDSGSSAWENNTCVECDCESSDEDEATCQACGEVLPRPVVREDGSWRLISGFRNSSYRRMHPDRPAAAVTTASGRMSSDNTIHPSENRVLSAYECQHLQTIPADFQWGEHLDGFSRARVREMIGEAVPPQFTELHGRILVSLLSGRSPRSAISRDDARVVSATVSLGFRALGHVLG